MAINKILGIEGANITWNIKQISKMIGQAKIVFDNIVQRSYVWEVARRSELIWSVIMGYPIPPIYAKRGITDNIKVKIYDTLDGQQRFLTYYKFFNDEFALSTLKPIPYLDEEDNECEIDISGMKYSELPEEIKDVIDNRTMTIYYYDDLTQVQQSEMFRRLNNGKPLSVKSRTLASCKDINGLLDIGSHEIFNDMLSDKGRDNKNQVSIVVKCWCMLNQDIKDVSFESKKLNPLIENTEITEANKMQLLTVFDRIKNVHDLIAEDDDKVSKKIAKKIYKETHLVSLVPFVSKSIQDNIEESLFTDWVRKFFESEYIASISEEYNLACTQGSAKNENIQTRHNELLKSYNEFFMEEESENEENSEQDVAEQVKESEETVESTEEEPAEEEEDFTASIMKDMETSEDDEENVLLFN